MKPRWRNKRTGKLSFVITPTPQRLEADDLVTIIADSWDGVDDTPEPLSQKRIETIVRAGLTDNGRQHYYFAHEGWDRGDQRQRWEWAVRQVRRHWPELADQVTPVQWPTDEED